MRYRRKELVVPSESDLGYTITRVHNPPGTMETTSYGYIPTHTQQVDAAFDENHRKCYPNCGGPFYCFHRKITYGRLNMLHGHDYIYANGKRDAAITKGGFIKPYPSFSSVPAVAASGVLSDPFSTTFDEGKPLDATFDATYASTANLGSEAYKRFRPKLDRLNFIESIKELPETLAMFKPKAKKYTDLGKKYGDAYVATRFGWLPFVKDVIGFCDLVINSEAHISWLVKRNGRWSRRSGLVSDFQDGSYNDLPLGLDSSYRVPAGGSPTRVFHSVKFRDKSTFVGSFRYYIPGIDQTSFAGRFSALTVLSGLRLTPSNIYHAMPWTWLVDWTTRAGDWVDNYSSTVADDCCCKFAWISRRIEAESKLTIFVKSSFKTPKSTSPVTYNTTAGTSSVKYTKICRYGAAPTFSLSGGSLTSRQALILHSIMRGRV